eukprot:7682285-Karenia_brevis.AAC.1
MVAEQDKSRERSDEEIAQIVSLVVQGLLPQMQRMQHPGGRVETVDESKKARLDEKYFRRME